MKCSSIALVAALCTGPVLGQPQSGPRTGAPDPARAKVPDAEALKRADAAFHQARRKCEQQPQSRREDCLRMAREQHDASVRAASGPVPPAVQTESSAVSATGVAPPTGGQRTPGTPALPAPAKSR